jgi:hypothetical protein
MSTDDPDDEDRRRRLRRRDPDADAPEERRRRPPRREQEFEATEILIPTGVSGYSIAACYIGLVSCFLPVIGLVFALVAVVCGAIALRRRKKTGTYGAVTGDIRAVVGIVLGSVTLLVHIGFLVYAIVKANVK